MRTIFILLTFVFVPFIYEASAQQILSTLHKNRADKKFQEEAYVSALELYQKALSKGDTTGHILGGIAESYFKLNKYKQAEPFYNQLFQISEPDTARYYLQYADVLRASGQYNEAQKWVKKYRQKRPQAAISQVFSSRDFVEKLKADSSRFKVTRLDINTKASDFGPAFYHDSIVFSSAQEVNSKLIKQTYDWNEEPFLNLYVAAWKGGSNLGTSGVLSEELITKYHEGPVDFVQDDKVLYYTRNNYLKLGTDDKRVNRLKIYQAVWSGNQWKQHKELSINGDEFSTGHPTLTDDGRTMYFSSDRPGGYGGPDIYVTHLTNDGWSEPENLGSKINTEGKEMFPFLHSNGTLYYSSNGKSGLGGLDIYVAYPEGSGFSKPENMGYPLNSSRDDFSFILADDNMNGFFSSNRTAATSDDIYHVHISPVPPVAVLDTLTIKKYKRNVPVFPLKNDIRKDCDSIYLWSLAKRSTQDVEVNIRDKRHFTYTPPEGFVGKDTIAYAARDTFSFYKGIDSNLVVINVSDAYYGVEGEVVYKNSGEPVPGVEITLFNEERTTTFQDTSTNAKGDFEFELQPHKDYAIRYVKDSLINLTEYITTKNMEPGILKVKQVIEMEKLEVGKTFAVKIYFDLDKSNIRPDAAEILDKEVYTFLTDNPTVTIELSAHTDSRGNNAYNKALSQRRAESSVQYLIDQGIDPERMQAKGYGEDRLVNECADGVSCSDEKHQENRRVEIEILSF